MKNKTLEFIINGAISTVPFIVGGIAGAELSELVTDSKEITSGISTATQYAAGYSAFMTLQARDNRDVYQRDGRWDYKKLMLGTAKTAFSLGVAEVAYIFGRSGLIDYFLNKDYSPTASSILADSIAIPMFFLVAIPLAKKTGLIKRTE